MADKKPERKEVTARLDEDLHRRFKDAKLAIRLATNADEPKDQAVFIEALTAWIERIEDRYGRPTLTKPVAKAKEKRSGT